jgi:hypothetical protein
MTEHELRIGRSVERPYAKIKDLIAQDALGLFRRATASAAMRAEPPDATLRAIVAGLDVHTDVCIEITSFDMSGRPPAALTLPGCAVAFRWRAAYGASLFPSMRTTLTVYPLSHEVTQLDFHGWYTPPWGVIGAVADAINHHRIAEASARRFLDDIVRRLVVDAA